MSKSEWEPVVASGIGLKNLFSAKPCTSAPIQMRKRSVYDGKWIYREPTQEEIEDYLASEAW